MNEYKKRLAQQGNQKLNSETAAPQGINGIPNSVLNDVFSGKRRATNEMMGHRTDPAPSVLARMSQAFGMDFSGVQVYRSDAMNGTGMHGMAQGNKVVLGSDVDLNTQEGQAILGHEFSHIRAQSMGIGGGSGLLQDAALEHQADNEGLLAARGMSISGESMGMTTGLGMAGFEGLTPLGGGMSANAAAPMQASWKGGGDKPAFRLGKQFEDPKSTMKDPILAQAHRYWKTNGDKQNSFQSFNAAKFIKSNMFDKSLKNDDGTVPESFMKHAFKIAKGIGPLSYNPINFRQQDMNFDTAKNYTKELENVPDAELPDMLEAEYILDSDENGGAEPIRHILERKKEEY